MDSDNQYNSLETPIVPENAKGFGNLTETMLQYLKQASPWMQFIGILGFITCGLIAVGSIFLTVGLASAFAFLGEFGNIPIWLVVPLYLSFGVLLFFPSFFAFNIGSKIRRHQYSNADEDLEQAFKNNKSLWKFSGIMCIISIASLPVILILTVLFSFITALR
ncbi:MAG: hypothetical protein FWC01_05565 [Treponema sp.]|nr:hypothetical protein [Treponema sp.]MCL2237333.1 hypothetical protein [Treponema sp.]